MIDEKHLGYSYGIGKGVTLVLQDSGEFYGKPCVSYYFVREHVHRTAARFAVGKVAETLLRKFKPVEPFHRMILTKS